MSLTQIGRVTSRTGIFTPVAASRARFSLSGQKSSHSHVGVCQALFPQTSGWPWIRTRRVLRNEITGSTAGRRQFGFALHPSGSIAYSRHQYSSVSSYPSANLFAYGYGSSVRQ